MEILPEPTTNPFKGTWQERVSNLSTITQPNPIMNLNLNSQPVRRFESLAFEKVTQLRRKTNEPPTVQNSVFQSFDIPQAPQITSALILWLQTGRISAF